MEEHEVIIARWAVVRTIRVYRETLLEACAHDPTVAVRLVQDDPGMHDALLEIACRQTGLDRDLYEAALSEDPELMDLHRLTVREIVVDPPDPGPYSEISRESPAGTPANWHLHAWNGITPVGGVGGSGPAGAR
jgi:hypothetical protein